MVKPGIQIKPLKINITDECSKITMKYGEICSNEIKQNSPSEHGDYKKGWTYEFSDGIATIYQGNSKRTSITYLLEKGHVIVRQGEQVGFSKAIPHIRPAFLKNRNKYLEDLSNIKINPM